MDMLNNLKSEAKRVLEDLSLSAGLLDMSEEGEFDMCVFVQILFMRVLRNLLFEQLAIFLRPSTKRSSTSMKL